MNTHYAMLFAGLGLMIGAGCGGAKPCDTKPQVPVERGDDPLAVDAPTRAAWVDELVAKHGEGERARIERGIAQVLERWRASDGSAAELKRFLLDQFVSGAEAVKDTLHRLEYSLEMLDGHANEVNRELSRFAQLDEGPQRPADKLLAAYSPFAHITDDLFKTKIAFVALLNFPISRFEERIAKGAGWSRERWAIARLTGRFEHRVPAEIYQQITRAYSEASRYIDNYNIFMGKVIGADGKAPFPAKLKLISHWGLRDEIGGLFLRDDPLPRQRLIATIMERIVRQELPAEVVNKAELEWDPVKNLVRKPGGEWHQAKREPDTRYQRLLDVFHALRRLDPYYPEAPTHFDRKFEHEREISAKRMRELLRGILEAPVVKQVGALIAKRLGRKLEPFDLWYNGFRPGDAPNEPALDAITRQRYPTAAAFREGMPELLGQLGFSAETAKFLQEHIEVDPSRGAGHALGARRRADHAHLRTRVGKDGMDYKGYNIAVHELGHNVEQVFSISRIDHTLLEGVPNNAFTEAFAFLFQSRDLELLGQAKRNATAVALATLDSFWQAYEIAGVAMLDMDLWQWLYAHPQATPAELREAMVSMVRDVWNRYYAPVFGIKDQILPAIYSHIIAYALYVPDYPIGLVITAQIEDFMKGKVLGVEMERMCRQGRLTPDLWMKQAVGSEISTEPLVRAAQAALKQLAGDKP